MRTLAIFAIACCLAGAQATETEHLALATRAALEKNDLIKAADLAAKLDDAVRRTYETWLVRDAGERVTETLSWLPADTETFWVNQTPFVVDAERPDVVPGRPNLVYVTDRLRALDSGRVWKSFSGRTIRLAMFGARDFKFESSSTPAVAPQGDFVYFYFFDGPIDLAALPDPDTTVTGKPVWTAAGLKQDEHWYSLAKPDLLILATRKASLDAVLKRVAGEPGARALPDSLPEWRLVDRSAGFQGLRHAEKEGAALSYDVLNEKLEIRRITSESPVTPANAPFVQREFQMDQPDPGVLRLIADIKTRGDFPFHHGMTLLGMGEYR
jgi:hypothetical protein